MNHYLESACGWFGAWSCESASGMQIFMMVFAAAFGGLFIVWLIGRINFTVSN